MLAPSVIAPPLGRGGEASTSRELRLASPQGGRDLYAERQIIHGSLGRTMARNGIESFCRRRFPWNQLRCFNPCLYLESSKSSQVWMSTRLGLPSPSPTITAC